MCTSTGWKFHYINCSENDDEEILKNELNFRVAQRGTNTNGWRVPKNVLPEHRYLFEPYPNPLFSCNEDIKLFPHFKSITIIMNDVLPQLSSPNGVHCDNLLDLLIKDTVYRDVKFVLQGGITIEAHMPILAVRSPVLGRMLTSNMAESKSRNIEVLDVIPQAVRIFIDAFYNIELPNGLKLDVWEAVFWLCDKYQVDFLIPKLLKRTKSFRPEKLFVSLFDIFEKIPRLRHYIVDNQNAFIIDVLKIRPENRTKTMQDFLLGAHLCPNFQGYC